MTWSERGGWGPQGRPPLNLGWVCHRSGIHTLLRPEPSGTKLPRGLRDLLRQDRTGRVRGGLAGKLSKGKERTAMKSLTALILALVALGTLPSSSAAQGERRLPSDAISPVQLCPKGTQPQTINLTASAPAAATPYLPDFPANCGLGWEPNFGGTTINRCFRHTFTWKAPGPGCSCQSAVLTLHYKALQGGPAGSSTSVNDTMSIFSGGSAITSLSQALFSGAVTTGQTGTKTVRLNCDLLKNNRLSIYEEDDTSVTSASLQVTYCCSPCPQGQVEETFPGTNLKYCCEGKPGAPRFCCTAKEKPVVSENPQ